MTPARQETQVLRLVRATVVLAIFYAILFRVPIPGTAGKTLQPRDLQRLQERSAALRRAGKWQRAIEPALRLHTEYPENHIYIDNMAEIYSHLGRYREEAAMWELFLTRAPLPGEGCPQIGQAYEKQGKPKETLDAFERCLAFDPADTDSIYYLAHTLERQGLSERAAAMYERGVALSPNYSDMQIGLARMRLRQDRASEAKQIAETVVKRSPENVDALLVLGLAWRSDGNRARARTYLERGSKLADRYADFHIVLGGMAEQDNDINGAIRHYQKVTDIDRRNTSIALRLDALKKARY